MSSRRRIPPEYVLTMRSAASAIPTSSSSSSLRARRSRPLIPCTRPWSIRFSQPVPNWSTPESCGVAFAELLDGDRIHPRRD